MRRSILALSLLAASLTFAAAPQAAAQDKQKCWSAQKCTGKVLNNKDCHNCRQSGGKSWSDKYGGACTPTGNC